MARPESIPYRHQEHTIVRYEPGRSRPVGPKSLKDNPWAELERQSDYIQQQYFGEKRSAKSLGEELGVKGREIVIFLQGEGCATRGPREAIKAFLSDKGRKTEHNENTHSLQANLNRAEAVRSFHANHPDRSKEIADNARKRGREQAMQNMVVAFGDDPKATLVSLHMEQDYR